MKRVVSFVLAVIMIFNLGIIFKGNIASAEGPDVIWLEKEYDDINNFSEGFAKVKVNGKYGFIDKTGKEIIPTKYDWAGDFNEGLARVALDDKAGYIDKKGKVAIPLKYEWAGDFSEGFARVVLNDKFGYIDETGKEIIPTKYEWAGDFSEDLAATNIGYINQKGEVVIPYKNLEIQEAWDFSEGLAQVEIRGQNGFIDKNGKLVIPAIYSSMYDELGFWIDKEEGFGFYEELFYGWRKYGDRSFKEGLAHVRNQDWEWGYIDKSGKTVISFGSSHFGSGWDGDFSEGLAIARLNGENGELGYINKIGKEVISYKYDYAYDFSEGLASVELNGKYGYIDKTGKEIIPFELENAKSFNEGLALVTFQGKKAIIKNPLKFESAHTNITKEMEKMGYKGYKKAYYEYLKEFAKTKKEFEMEGYPREGRPGKNAILLDLNSDGIPELITIDYFYSDWGSTNQEIVILTYENDALKHLSERLFLSDNSWTSNISFAEGKETGEKVIIEYGNFHRQASGDYIYLMKWHQSQMERHEILGYYIGDEWIDEQWKTVEKFYVEEQPVDKEYYNKKLEEFRDRFEIIDLGSPIDLTEQQIRNIIDSYIDEPINISHDSDNIISIIGSKTFLDLEISEKDADLIYEVDNPDIVQVTSSGEITGLKEGSANIKVIARKSGFQEGEILIPITVKPKLSIDFSKVTLSSDNKISIKYLEDVLKTSDSIYFKDSETLTEITKLIDFIIKKGSRGTIKSSKNIITVNEKTIKNAMEEAKKTRKAIEDLLKQQQISLQREIDTTVRLDGLGIKENKSVGVRLDSTLLQASKELDYINIGLGQAEVTLNVNSLEKDFEARDVLQIEIIHNQNESKESYEIIFMDEKGNPIKKLENNITFHLLINNQNPKYSAVFLNTGESIEQLGGQYDPITNMMEFGTKLTGEYYIVENQKNYKDIGHLAPEVQNAITFMASKGFINGRDEDNFDPNSEITRAELTSFLVKTFYVLDRTLTLSFIDVEKNDWYYDYVASSEKEGIIKGYPDQTFRGDDIINREQIVAVCARALHEKKKYLYPEFPEDFLPFADSDYISDWAKKEVALAFRETLIDMPEGRMFESQKPMTRADAAVIVYRLFQLLYETSPSELGNLETSNSDIPIIPIVGGGGLVTLGVLGGYFLNRKRATERV